MLVQATKEGWSKNEKFIIKNPEEESDCYGFKNPGEESDCCSFNRLLTGANLAISGNVIVSFLVTGRKNSSDKSE